MLKVRMTVRGEDKSVLRWRQLLERLYGVD